jgi:hypothetical protein
MVEREDESSAGVDIETVNLPGSAGIDFKVLACAR